MCSEEKTMAISAALPLEAARLAIVIGFNHEAGCVDPYVTAYQISAQSDNAWLEL